MSGEIVQRSESFAVMRDSRRTDRAVKRRQDGGRLRMTEVDVEVDVSMAKVEGLTMVTADAMSGVARLAQAQTQLEQQVPEASGRLAFIAETHVLCVGDVLRDLRHDLRRK